MFALADSASGEADPLASLRPDHPRLFANTEDFNRLKKYRADAPRLDANLDAIEQQATRLLETPTLERRMTGMRLLWVSRDALDRISKLALAYHSTGDQRYAERAERELLAVCRFEDWNPSHFLDTAEMAVAVALGYDWLHEQLSVETRAIVASALRDKAVALIDWDHWWTEVDHNWNSVCFSGMTIAALAIAEHEPELAKEVLRQLREHNPKALTAYEPDGVYPEGPIYWIYGMTYQVMLASVLETALGDDLDTASPALLASGEFFAHSIGPTGLCFNFSDCRAAVGTPSALLWVSHRARNPWLYTAVSQLIGSRSPRGNRFQAIEALWLARANRSADPTEPTLSWHGNGDQPVAMFRTSWSDPNAMYLAIKGGRADLNHGHMDAGSFVFEADGVRWAIDPGMVSYHAYESRGIKLFDHTPGGDRWRIFPYTNHAHNTLTMGGRLYDSEAAAQITHYKALEDGRGEARIDLAPVIVGADAAVREFTFHADLRSVTVTDTIEGLQPEETICWTLVTRGAPAISGSAVVLTQDGKSLRLTANDNANGQWSVLPYAPPEGFYGETSAETSLVTFSATAPADGRYRLQVTLEPSSGHSSTDD